MKLTPEQRDQFLAAAAALLDGKPIEYLDPVAGWIATHSITNDYLHRPRVVKPWTLPEPPKGKEWHRTDWTEDMLPDGYRPLMRGELAMAGDEYALVERKGRHWYKQKNADNKPCDCFDNLFQRTLRPLPTEPEPRYWDTETDVPGPVCWLRERGNVPCSLVVMVEPCGVICIDPHESTASNQNYSLSWEQLHDCEYSTDRVTWQPCHKKP